MQYEFFPYLLPRKLFKGHKFFFIFYLVFFSLKLNHSRSLGTPHGCPSLWLKKYMLHIWGPYGDPWLLQNAGKSLPQKMYVVSWDLWVFSTLAACYHGSGETPKLYPRIKGHFTTILHPNDCHEDHYPSLPKTFCLEAFGNRNWSHVCNFVY